MSNEQPYEEIDRIERRRSEGSRLQVWHLVVSVIGLVLALALQTGTAVWWAATIQADVKNAKLERAAEKRMQNKIDERQDSDIKRQEDQRREEQKEIMAKLDWIMKNMPRR